MSAGEQRPEDAGPAGSPLTFDVTLTEQGYRRVLLHLAALRLRFVPPALGMAALLAYSAGMRTEAIALFGGGIAIPIVVWGYLAWLSGSPSSRSLYAPVHYEFTGEGIVFASPEGDGELAWDSVVRWKEAADHLLIYVSGSNYLLLPIDGLAAATLDRIEFALADKVGPRGRRAGRLR
ncbi:MAG: YcxB family protein [Coriobacteriia bacterium]|nr:YcxB family protein [Coriobacteriia bacterium]